MEPFLQQLLPRSLSEIHKYSWFIAGSLLDATSLELILALHEGFSSLI